MHIHLSRLVLVTFALSLALPARADIGVTVNGTDIAAGSGAGWTFAGSTLSLTGGGPFVISGSNGTNRVSIAAVADCAVVASNLTVDVSAFSGVTAFDCGTNAVSLSLWSGAGATNAFTSGAYRAGIRVASNATACASLAITNLNAAAALAVTGGSEAAGIGGNNGGESCGRVLIRGGDLTVQGGRYAAGIGGGDGPGSNLNGGAGGTVEISGGFVTALAGADGGAGIGGGDGGAGGTVRVSGGTVTATGQGGVDIGNGARAAGGVNLFIGGSVHLVNGSVSLAPSNGTEAVSCWMLTGFAANEAVTFTGLENYGTNGIVADAGGKVYLWLPKQTVSFTANGRTFSFVAYTVTATAGEYGSISPSGAVGVWADESQTFLITPDTFYKIADVKTNGVSVGAVSSLTVSGLTADLAITATFEFAGVGVTVNGVDIFAGSGAGWTFAGTNLTLSGAGPYVISGANTVPVSIVAAADCTVVASNLTVDVSTFSGVTAFDCGTNAVALSLAGPNTFKSGSRCAGIRTTDGLLTITNLNESAALAANAGSGGAGLGGAGIGGGFGGAGGTVTISGGTVTATGDGAGIGGGDGGAGGTVRITGGTVTATGDGAGIGGGDSGAGGTVTISGGTVTATGGGGGAGLGGGIGGAGGTVRITGGTVTATGGGDGGAGIGGGDGDDGDGGAGGTVTISGGTVTATGGGGGAGIGGGGGGAGGTVTISGGTVTATGGIGGAGIGGGGGGAGGTVRITGGTVVVAGNQGQDIGYGVRGSGGTAVFTGGSILAASGTQHVSPSPVNAAGARVWCVTLTGWTAGARAELDGFGDYGANDIYADASGKVCLWLAPGTWLGTAGGKAFKVVVSSSGSVTMSSCALFGITVNGADISAGSGGGWTFAKTNLTLSGAGPYVIRGSNGTNAVSIVAAADCAVVASNLTVDASSFSNCCAFAVASNVTASLSLAGTNGFASGARQAGIHVPPGAAVAISDAPGAAAAYLCVTGGVNAAGIGGNYGTTVGEGCGTVRIGGGEITVAGGKWGAGIGGGDGEGSSSANGGAGGDVTITGGRVSIVVSSSTTSAGAAIGGGDGGAGGTVRISGGTVFAQGTVATDIGPGKRASGGVNVFTGGSIFLANGSVSWTPSNGTARVWCVTMGGFAANAPVSLGVGGTSAYGTADLFADASGKVYLWLPAGNYIEGGSLTAGGVTNAFLKGFSVSTSGGTSGFTNAVLTITTYDAATGAMTYSPEVLPDTVLTTIFSTNLVDWAETIPANTNTLFMKLKLK